MALITCPECGGQLSSFAKLCPHCGYSLEKSSTSYTPAIRNFIDAIRSGSKEVCLGHWSQNSSTKNPISWIVLYANSNEALLLSKTAVDFRGYGKYTKEAGDLYWENCGLRTWLNNDFYNEAFSDDEKSIICLSELRNDDNPEFYYDGGPDTFDKVFLLSIEEVDTFLPDMESRVLYVPDFLRTPHIDYVPSPPPLNVKEESNAWWLRTRGCVSGRATYVYYRGAISSSLATHYDYIAVRPAIKIRLSNAENISISPIEKYDKIYDVIKQVRQGEANVLFGKYKYDEDNETKPIIWDVMENKGRRALLVSKYVLDTKKVVGYVDKCGSAEWACSDLRHWLNNEFYNSAFSIAEREYIVPAYVYNKKWDLDCWTGEPNNPHVYGYGKIDTTDKIFILSRYEADRFYGRKPSDLKAMATMLAEQHGIAVVEENRDRYCKWRLRNVRLNDYMTLGVDENGCIKFDCKADSEEFGIRPAFWLRIE